MKRPIYVIAFLLLGPFLTTSVFPNHIPLNVTPVPSSYGGSRPYSIKYDYIQVRIDNNIAHTEVEQVLRNHTGTALETQIIFPFPEGAAVTNYNMWMGEELMKGELLEKDRARSIYQEIVRKKKDPALLQFVGSAAFRSSVYPVPPRGEKKLRFAYDETLHYDSGVYKYEYVLGTGRFSEKPFEKLVIEARIHSGKSIRSVYSPTHDIEVKRVDDYNVDVKYEAKNISPDINFELYYSVSEDDVGLSLMTYREKGKDGYFMVMATPKLDFADENIVGKNVIFVFDRSGSMSGDKISQARGALEFCLNSLNKKDNFSLITFGTDVESLNSGLVKASKANVRKALDFVRDMKAIGGTDIHSALTMAMVHAGKRDTELIFLTDGLPTIGPKADVITRDLAKSMGENIRLFVFGVGYNVNTHFLDRISTTHNGFSKYVRPQEDIEIKVSSFFTGINCPIFKDIAFEFDGVSVYDVYPKKLHAIFKGSQILIFGRYRSVGRAEIKLTGTTDGRKRTFTYATSFPENRVVNDFIPKIWASRKIGYLSEQIRLSGTNKELVDEIVQLSREYGIITEFTSFLVEQDRNMSRAEMNEATEYNFENANKIEMGSWAVSQGMNSARLQFNDRIFDNKNNDRSGKVVNMNGTTRQVRGRAFYYRNGQWIDSTLERYEPDKEVKNYSDEYFKFSDENDDYNEYMSLGDDVIVNHEGRAIRFH